MFDGHEKKGHKNVAPSFFHSLRLRKWEESPKNKGLWNIYIYIYEKCIKIEKKWDKKMWVETKVWEKKKKMDKRTLT